MQAILKRADVCSTVVVQQTHETLYICNSFLTVIPKLIVTRELLELAKELSVTTPLDRLFVTEFV